jgi:hypothetical protein
VSLARGETVTSLTDSVDALVCGILCLVAHRVSRQISSSAPRKQSKTYKVPKRPYEAARLDAELKVRFIGVAGSAHEGVWMAKERGQLGLGGCRDLVPSLAAELFPAAEFALRLRLVPSGGG